MQSVASYDAHVPPNDRLRNRRLAADLTREQLAYKAGVSVRSIAGYELEGRRPGMAIAERIAAVLGCTIDELFNGNGDPLAVA